MAVAGSGGCDYKLKAVKAAGVPIKHVVNLQLPRAISIFAVKCRTEDFLGRGHSGSPERYKKSQPVSEGGMRE